MRFKSDNLIPSSTDTRNSENIDYQICNSGDGQITAHATVCKIPVDWNIGNGFVSDSRVYLIDKSNTVYSFPKSAINSENAEKPAKVDKIEATKFWSNERSYSMSLSKLFSDFIETLNLVFADDFYKNTFELKKNSVRNS